jgi:hypothetical protein
MNTFGERLPIDLKNFNEKRTESVGSDVLTPLSKDGAIVKLSKKEYEKNLPLLKQKAIAERNREVTAHSMSSSKSREAFIPQLHLIVEGEQFNKARLARIQKFADGQPLKKLGFFGVMSLEKKHLITLRGLIFDSMKCYLKYGVNFDLFGSDERDAFKKSRILNIRRMIFPLRNSSNLVLTKDEIKFVDPDTLGYPDQKKSLTAKSFQLLLFASSFINYLMLSVKISLSKNNLGK